MFGNPVTNPKGWKTTELEGLCELIVDCPHSTPIYAEQITPFPCIRTSDIQKGFVDWSTTKYVNEDEYFKRITRDKPQAGDVLYTREGERFGLAARVPKGTTLCLGQRMMLLKANSKMANGEFLCTLMNSSGVYQQASKLVGGSTSPHVNVGDIKCFKAFMPPLPLQEKFAQIVQKFERLRTQQREGDRQAEHLFQTLLHRAFRGELTPQDSNDEPASVLLEEIGAEQAKAEAEAKAATQPMGDAAEYLGTKAKQQDTKPIQLTIPGIE
jgi:type I restriction enzyme S subunit